MPTAAQQRIVTAIRDLKVSDIPRPGNVLQLAQFLKGLGLNVSGHSGLPGGQGRGHSPRSRHYRDQAIDVNIPGVGNEFNSQWAKDAFNQLENKLYAAGWQDIIWRADGHYDHMHVGSGPPEPLARTSTGFRQSGRPAPAPNADAAPAATTAATSSGTTAQSSLPDIGYIAPNAIKNILNQYRSWTYNVSMGVFPQWSDDSSRRSDFAYLDTVVNNYHVFDSSGKAGKGDAGPGVFTDGSPASVLDFLNEYNESSPGRFDLFVDNLSIRSTASVGDQQVGPAATFNIDFDLYEPVGMSGFMEALQAAAMAAGFASYRDCKYVIKIWFTGYLDSVDLPKPETIPESTRYFSVTLSKIEATVNEEGTRYRVSCLPADDLAFGLANHHFAPITVSGNTVFSQVRMFFDELNKSIRRERGETAPSLESASVYDVYEVSFPVSDPASDNTDPILSGMVYSPNPDRAAPVAPTATHNAISHALMPEPGRDRSQANTVNIANSNMTYFGSEDLAGRPPLPPNTMPAQADSFICQADRQIHLIISDIILRSNYVSRNVLQEQLPNAKSSNTNNYITYFKIKTEVDTGDFDTLSNRYSKIYRYIVMPYRMHYTVIPGQDQGNVDYRPVLKEIKKEYNYIYTGKNTDVLKFEVKYDNLAVTALPALFGNDGASFGLETKTGPANTVQTIRPESQAANDAQAGNAAATAIPANPQDRSATNQTPSLRDFLQSDDPYGRFSQILNDSLLGLFQQSMVSIDLEILGDPYFLVSRGPDTIRLADPQTTTAGHAPIDSREIYVNLKFKTPVDIHKSDGKPGLADFGNRDRLLPFSGIYRIFSVDSNFKGGVFTQTLKLGRCQAQIVTTDPPSPAQDIITTRSAVPGASVVADSADPSVNRHGIREDHIDFAAFFNRGLPSVGLPGSPSDFTSSLASAKSALLTKVSGATANFANSLGPVTENMNQAMTSGIKISPAALNSAVSDLNAAAVGVAGSMMEQVSSIQDAAQNLASDMVNQVESLGTTLRQNVDSLEDDFAQVVGDARDSVQRLQNSVTTDPSGVASKLGIDPQRLSGLGKELASKVTEEFNKVAELVPNNTNLAGLEASGVVFANMVGSKLANLPPLQPRISAPRPIFDPARVAVTDANGNVIPLLNGRANLAALTETNNVKNSLAELASGYETRFRSAAQTILDKVGTVQLSVNDISAFEFGVPNPVGSLNQNSLGTPSPASVGLGSVESNSGGVGNLVQATANTNPSNLNITLAAQVGTKQATSPLTTLVNDSNIQGKLV